MGKEQRFVEAGAVCRDAGGGGDTGERFEFVVAEGQRHEAGARGDHIKPEVISDLIGEAGCAHFRDRFAACRDDQISCGDLRVSPVACQGRREVRAIVGDVADRRIQPQLRAGFVHFRSQHRDDVFCSFVAEQLTERFFMPRDAVVRHQIDEIPLRVTFQRGFGEMGVLTEELGVCRAHIREIAASTAGNADLFARCFGMVYDHDARTRVSGGHHACGTCAKDESLDMHVAVGGLKFEPVQEAGRKVAVQQEMKAGAAPVKDVIFSGKTRLFALRSQNIDPQKRAKRQ